MSDFWTRFLGPARPRTLLGSRPPAPPPFPDEVPRVEGIPLIRLSGTPRERGERHGRLLGAQVRALVRHYLDRFIGPARARFLEISGRLLASLTDEERDEIEGLAHGLAELRPEDARLAATFLDAHKTVYCSNVVATHHRTGRPLFGRNLDFPSYGIAHRLGAVFVHEASDEIPHATVGWPGLLGALSGMNREGLTLALNLVYGESDASDGVPATFALRRVLARAPDLPAAEDLLRRTRFASTNNVTVCDARGRAGVFEVGPGGTTVRTADGPVWATNHFASCRTRPTLSPLSLSSHVRFRKLASRRRVLEERATGTEVIRALRLAAMPMITLQSMVFEPADRTFRLATGRVPAARGRFVRFGRRLLFGE